MVLKWLVSRILLRMFKRVFSSSPIDEIVLDGISFTIKHFIRPKMKRVILRIEEKNELRLSSARVSKKRLLDFVQENKEWILHRQKNLKEAYEAGGSFYYLNKHYRIEHHDNDLLLQEDRVLLNQLKGKLQSDNFYKECAKSYLPGRVEYWKEKMGVEFNALGFRLAKKRWGSCNSKRNISLNPYMMKLSYEMIDYIIVHELSHLVHLNHSKAFYQCVQEYVPDYLTIEKEIKRFSLRLS